MLVVFFKWQGSGGLKVCPESSDKECKVNLDLCSQVANDEEVKVLYGVYKVKDLGVVTLDRSKVKRDISTIMCSLRKLSAYKKQVNYMYM